MNDPRDTLLEIQHQLEELRPQVVFLASAIANSDEDEELATGASFLLFGVAAKIKAMTEQAATTFRQEQPAT